MATTSICLSLTTTSVHSILNLKPRYPLRVNHSSSLCFDSPSGRVVPLRIKTTQIRRISAVAPDSVALEANPVENSQQIVSSGGDGGVSIIISALLFIAFVGLSILTIGVIYIAVTDYLQKREKEKFEKEEARKKKNKSGKKKKVRARAGPRGFGQKLEEDDEF